jgi:hypothetical protein
VAARTPEAATRAGRRTAGAAADARLAGAAGAADRGGRAARARSHRLTRGGASRRREADAQDDADEGLSQVRTTFSRQVVNHDRAAGERDAPMEPEAARESNLAVTATPAARRDESGL